MTIIETERLLFREHTLEDLDPFCMLEADPEVRKFIGGQPRTRNAAEHKFRTIFLKPLAHGLGLRASVFKPEGRYIGYCGIYPHFGPAGVIAGEGTLGFTLARSYWSRGLATEAARAFVAFGFEKLRLSRIVASVDARNSASMHILEKLGFKLLRTEIVNIRSIHHLQIFNSLSSHSAT